MKLQKLWICAASLALCVAGQTAFGALVITEAVPSPGGANTVLQQMDWWELTNTGPSAVSLDGFEWIARDVTNNNTAVFPNGISVASGESIIILRDGTSSGSIPFQPTAEAEFRSDWGLAPSVQILMENTFTGLALFSGLGSTSELIHLYDGPPPTLGTANLLASAPEGIAATGVSFEWGTDTGGSMGRLSVGGQNGAITLADGRVASPGFATIGPSGPHTIFEDTFELSAASLQRETNLNAEMALPRQSFATSAYAPHVGDAAIEQDPFGAGSGDWLSLTATQASAGVDLDLLEDFAPSIAGKRYSISYTSRVDVPAVAPVDFWQGFSVADDFAPNSVNDPFTDFGILLRADGSFQVFLDSVAVGGSGPGFTGIVSGQAFDVEFVFDETLASPTVTGTVTATLGTVVLGTIPLDALGVGTGFEDISRFFELRTFLDGASALPGDVYDNRYDNFTISELGPAVTLIADFNSDGVVDNADLVVWQGGFGTGTTLAEGDADGNGIVDGQDFLLWQNNLGTSSPAVSAAGAVPEPTSCALAMMALALVAGVHRRRLGVA